jgi:hypothetical protein
MRAHPSARPLETFIALAGAVGSIDAIAGVLSEIPAGGGGLLRTCLPALNELLRRGLRSRRATDRSGAARMWLELIRLSVNTPGDIDEHRLRECFEREGDPITRAWLVGVLGELAGSDTGVETALRSASLSSDPNLRTKALPAWIKFVRRNGLVASRALDVVQAAATSPTDSGRLRYAGWLVDDLVPGHMDLARSVLEAIFFSDTLSELGRQGFRDLRSTLRSPVRKWMAEAPADLARSMLSLVPRLQPELGCLVVEAAAKGAFAALQADLARLMIDPAVPAEVRGYAEEHIRIRKNVLTAAPWPALDHLVIPE